MIVTPLAFGANFRVALNEKGVKKEQITNEVNTAVLARESGVSVPQYQVTAFEYETKGEKGDFYKNPITRAHFENVFKNIYLLDKNNIKHNDLDIEHVFYGKDGGVEIDCFRFSEKFKRHEEGLPAFILPTNQLNYEAASLAPYVNGILDESSKKEVVEDYLKASQKFHQKRSDAILERITLDDDDYVIYTADRLYCEVAKATVLKKPDEDKVDLMLQKLDFLGKQRKAFTEWDEGWGACGNEFNKERIANSIPMYLDAVKSAISYSYQAKALAQKASGEDKKYYEFEGKTGEYFANTYLSWLQGMVKHELEDERTQAGLLESEKKLINKEFAKIIDADFVDKTQLINEFSKFYREN